MRVGPYELEQRIGRGGMAEVWRARHVQWRLPVALKVLRDELGGPDAEALRHEVRLVASLSHPGIVRVLDQGTVPEGTPLSAGAPFLAMELLQGGTVHDEVGRITWPRLRWILLRVLDALAHAHAHGVVHRDLKPSNVLRDGGGTRIVLSDFGIAGLLDEVDDEQIKGTPAYMAPEQLLGSWREQGPWTDLYALGAMAWTLATGRRVFGRGDGAARGHVREQPGAFEPVRPCPEGFEAWLRRLLRKPPRARFQYAAEAAAALSALPATVRESAVVPDFEPVPEEPPTLVLVPLVLNARPVVQAAEQDASLPLPQDWRGPRRLRGVSKSTGRGVVAVRTPRLVGREPERDAIWGALRGVVDSGQPRALVLHGPSGIGKSRLAWWLCTRTHELGACSILIGRNGPDAGPDVGLAGMIARSVHGLGLDPGALRARVDAELPELGEDDREALVGMARPGLALRIDTTRWRLAVLVRWIRALAGRRPVVLWLDDAHWGLDGLQVVQALVAEADLPVLAVLTVQDEGLAEAPEAGELLAELVCERVAVGPLTSQESWELVSDLLGLAPGLAGQVTERSAGNPMLAIQLVADQVARDRLVVGEAGLELQPGTRLELPADLEALWSSRLDAELAGRDAHALELAAVLGPEVRWATLAEACNHLGVPLSSDVFERLLARRLLVAEGRTGFAFAHGMVREVLLRRAGERAPAYHGACADALEGVDGDEVVEQRGRHLVGAGRLDEALAPLLDAAVRRSRSGYQGAAATLLDLREEALRRLGVPDQGRAWASQGIARAELLFEHGQIPTALASAQRLQERAFEGGWSKAVAASHRMIGACHRNMGQPLEAVPHLEAALKAWRRLEEPARVGRCLTDLGDALTDLGRHAAAEACFTEARQVLADADAGRDLGRALVGLAHLARQRHDWTTARRWLEQGAEAYRRDNNRWGEAVVRNDLADYDRREGRLDQALAGFREARRVQVLLGCRPLVPEINIGFTLAELGRDHEAIGVLLPLEDFCDSWTRANFATHIRAGVLAPLIRLGREDDVRARLEKVDRYLTDEGLVDEEIAGFLKRASDLAPWPAVRERCARLAADQFERIG